MAWSTLPFFFHRTYYLRPCCSCCLLVVTQIRGHISGSSPLSLPFYLEKGSFIHPFLRSSARAVIAPVRTMVVNCCRRLFPLCSRTHVSFWRQNAPHLAMISTFEGRYISPICSTLIRNVRPVRTSTLNKKGQYIPGQSGYAPAHRCRVGVI